MREMLNVFIVVFLLSTLGFAGDWQVDGEKTNKVVFHSSTTLLDFEGTTNNIDGYIYWEGEKIFGDENELYFEVQLNTFETGNGKRDRDMRNDVLHTKNNPVASFKGVFGKVEKDKTTYNVLVKGELNLHGKTKLMEIPGIITLENGAMNLKTNFSIFLADYEIEAPSLAAFIKVAEEIKLELDFNLKESKK